MTKNHDGSKINLILDKLTDDDYDFLCGRIASSMIEEGVDLPTAKRVLAKAFEFDWNESDKKQLQRSGTLSTVDETSTNQGNSSKNVA